MVKITNSPEETVLFAQKIGGLLKGGEVIAYRGGLGAGKTTFTRGLCVGFGIGDDVTSPTFALVNEYRKNGKAVCHFDMYRINGSDDLETTGFYDYMDGETVLCVEWSENIEDALPEGTIFIDIVRIDDNKREIRISGDDRFENIGD
ncbi:MAG: tRNA (adenosine(37)-N6)-threonylcarbamoyltransferase complex ATPase subunit type 1 TsaE [Oscillospiraceae bacterium]|nr:tRNA (adenosine(37)-N6)-threonylcarbamoyltransferase complex ATPase subunit type 1 TsaE [Oscillospiraceae bacterium]